MAWITPVEWPAPAPVGEADFDRIEGDLKYLREETATFNGLKTFTNNITIESAKVGTWSFGSNYARFGHKDFDTSDNYGYLQRNTGALNMLGTSLTIGCSTSISGTLTIPSIATFAAATISLGLPTTVDSLLFSTVAAFAVSTTTAFIGKLASHGLVIGATTGSTNDFYLSNPSGASILVVPTGTKNIVMAGALTCASIDTGNGATEIYAMNQDLRTDDTATFAGITSTGAITLTTTPTSGSWTGITTIPAGIYMVALTYGNSLSYIQSGLTSMFQVTSTTTSNGGVVISDGTLKAVQAGTSTITYKKY